MVLICCASAISAVSDDVINDTVSETYSGEDFVSVVNDEQVTEVDDSSSALDTSKNNDKLMSVQENEKLSTSYSNITIDNLTVEDDDATVSNCTIGTLTVKSNKVTIFNNILNELILNGTNIIAYNNTVTGSITGDGDGAKVIDNTASGISLSGNDVVATGNDVTGRITLNGDNVVVSGNDLMGSSGSIVLNGNNVTVFENTLHGYSDLSCYGDYGKVYNNTCTNCGISIYGSNYTIYYNNAYSILSNGDEEGNIIHDNVITNWLRLPGGYVGSNSFVYNNTINVVYFGGANSNNILFVNNTIKEFSDLSNSHNITLINNIITNYFGNMNVDNITIVNNTITHYRTSGSGAAIIIRNSNNVLIKNNVAYYYNQNKLSNFGDAAFSVTGNNITVEDNYPLSPNLTVEVNDFCVGNTERLVVTMDPNAIGTVEAMYDGQTRKISMKNGVGRFAVSSFLTAIGKHKVTVIFTPDPNSIYGGPVEVTKEFTISRNDLPLNMTVGNATIGGDVVIDVVIPNKATLYGSIPNILLVIDGEEHVVDFNARTVSGVRDFLATYTINNISSGDHSIVAIFEGNDKSNAAYEIKTFTLTKANSTVDVSYGAPVIGEDLLLNISVVNATGKVAVVVDDADEVFVDLVNGSANYTIEKIAAGKHYITVAYNGDAANNGAIFSDSFTLDKATPSVDVTIGDLKLGEDATVTVTIANATGKVNVIVDGVDNLVDLVDSVATATIQKVTAGTHTVVANYAGDAKNEAVSNFTSFTLTKATPSVDVTIGDLKLGEDATVTVTIANATGKVNVIVDGVDNLVDLVDSVATATIQKVTAGTHTVVANYAGDAKNNVAYGSASKTLTVLSTEITDVNVDGDLNINAVLKDSNGKGIENATILYKIGAQNATVTTGANGIFTIKGEENAKVEISYGGSDLLFPASTVISLSDVAPTRVASEIIASKLTCNAVDTAAGEKGAMFKVTLKDASGNLITNASVQFALNGNIYNATTDENGVASVQVNINKANTYTCAISYLGDVKHGASFTAAKVVVNKKKTTLTAKAKSYKVKTKTKKYTATLKTIKGSSADGKTYLKAGKKVTITVNKKTYTAKTNSKGQVTFKITKLNKKGKYTAVIKFAGDNTYKAANKKVKITVK